MTTTATARAGAVGASTTPMLLATSCHTTRPTTSPSGTPTTRPITPMVVACQSRAEPSW